MQLSSMRDMQASYRGSVSTRTSTPWGSPDRFYVGGSTDKRWRLATMRDRARQVYRNNPVGRSLVQAETDNIVAEKLTLQARTDGDQFNSEAEGKWLNWLDRKADVRGMMGCGDLMRLSWQQPRIDGDGGFLLVGQRGESRLQYIPGDWIANPDGKTNSPRMMDGVETNAAGRPIAFHVRDEDEFGKRKFARIPAEDFVYLPHTIEPLDVRGLTCYATIFDLLDQLDRYVDSVTKAAILATIFGLIFKGPGSSTEFKKLATATNSKGDQQKALTLENGMLRFIGSEDDVVQVDAKQPLRQTPEFIRTILRLIAQPFDMPLELAFKDLSEVNFSSARIGLISYYRSCKVKQNWLASRCWSRIYRWWLSREVKMGGGVGLNDRFTASVPEQFLEHEFVGREWDYTDPVSEAKADHLEIDMGIKSPQQAAKARGRDWEDTQKQIAEAMETRTTLSLPTKIRSSMTRDEKTEQPKGNANGQ